MRHITSYAKCRKCIGTLFRNRRFQLKRTRALKLAYLDVGCGPNTHEEFVNVDFLWHPKIDVCWDIARGLPFPDNRFRGVFSEHVLEHFSLPAAERLLREIHRVLEPTGIARIVVPDGERYLSLYSRWRAGDTADKFPYQELESIDGWWTPMMSVNRVFYHDRNSPFGHWVTYDFEMLAGLLRRCGFTNIQRRAFRDGTEARLLIDTPARSAESLYVEASKRPTP